MLLFLFEFWCGTEWWYVSINVRRQGEVVLFVEANNIGIGEEVFPRVVLCFFLPFRYLGRCGRWYVTIGTGECRGHKRGCVDAGAGGKVLADVWRKLARELGALLLNEMKEASNDLHTFVESGALTYFIDGGCELVERIGLEVCDRTRESRLGQVVLCEVADDVVTIFGQDRRQMVGSISEPIPVFL